MEKLTVPSLPPDDVTPVTDQWSPQSAKWMFVNGKCVPPAGQDLVGLLAIRVPQPSTSLKSPVNVVWLAHALTVAVVLFLDAVWMQVFPRADDGEIR
jgi:hypothetical protein